MKQSWLICSLGTRMIDLDMVSTPRQLFWAKDISTSNRIYYAPVTSTLTSPNSFALANRTTLALVNPAYLLQIYSFTFDFASKVVYWREVPMV